MMDTGTVTSVSAERGREMETIITSDPTTVTRLERICTISVAMQVEITSMS